MAQTSHLTHVIIMQTTKPHVVCACNLSVHTWKGPLRSLVLTFVYGYVSYPPIFTIASFSSKFHYYWWCCYWCCYWWSCLCCCCWCYLCCCLHCLQEEEEKGIARRFVFIRNLSLSDGCVKQWKHAWILNYYTWWIVYAKEGSKPISSLAIQRGKASMVHIASVA